MNAFDRGEDIPITVVCTDEDGAALDCDDFVTIVTKIQHKHLGSLLDRLSLADSEVTANGTSGITFIVPGSVTVSSPLGVYEYQLKTTETDTDYASNTRTRTFRGDCFYFKQART